MGKFFLGFPFYTPSDLIYAFSFTRFCILFFKNFFLNFLKNEILNSWLLELRGTENWDVEQGRESAYKMPYLLHFVAE